MALRHSSQMFGEILRLWWWKTTSALAPLPEDLA
jgi:hypothetical protein